MSTIDAERLRELIQAAHGCRDAGSDVLKIADFWPLVDAAKAHLASLPRKETFTRFLVVSCTEENGPYTDEVDAQAVARRLRGIVVPLTGTATIPARKP